MIDVWVDSEGRARRVVTTDAAMGTDAGWVTTTEYFDFGLEADIQAPPAAEVVGVGGIGAHHGEAYGRGR